MIAPPPIAPKATEYSSIEAMGGCSSRWALSLLTLAWCVGGGFAFFCCNRGCGFAATVCFAAPALDSDRVAVLLSLKARGVSQRAVEAARSCLPSEDVFATASLEEARRAASEIVARGYGLVVSAGGDGTLSAAVSMISDARAACGEAMPLEGMPRFLALPLGTGE